MTTSFILSMGIFSLLMLAVGLWQRHEWQLHSHDASEFYVALNKYATALQEVHTRQFGRPSTDVEFVIEDTIPPAVPKRVKNGSHKNGTKPHAIPHELVATESTGKQGVH